MKKNKVTTKKKHTLLKGEGTNQHTLYGEFVIEEPQTDFADVGVKQDSVHMVLRTDWTAGRLPLLHMPSKR